MAGEKVLYTAKIHTTGGRDGASRSDDGRLDVKQSGPGSPGTGTNPEQLLAAGWSACYLSAMQLIAGKKNVKFPPDGAVDAEVDLCNSGPGEYFLRARMNVSMPGVDRNVAQEIAEGAHHICPYSKAMKGNIEVQTRVV